MAGIDFSADALGCPEQIGQFVQRQGLPQIGPAALPVGDCRRQVNPRDVFPLTDAGEVAFRGIFRTGLLDGRGFDAPALVRPGKIDLFPDGILEKGAGLFNRRFFNRRRS